MCGHPDVQHGATVIGKLNYQVITCNVCSRRLYPPDTIWAGKVNK